jgi:CHAT domain-containing protein/tetratricopeptide (TPR) repeat protein
MLGWAAGTAFWIALTSGMTSEARPSAADRSLRVADSLYRAADYDSAFAVIDRVEAFAASRSDSLLLARAVTLRGEIEVVTGQASRAERTLDRAVKLSRAAGDTTSWMMGLDWKARLLYQKGDVKGGLDLNDDRLSLALRSGSREHEAWARGYAAYVALNRGDYGSARDGFQRAVALFRSSGLDRGAIEPLIGIGRAAEYMGDHGGARAAWQEALLESRRWKDFVNEAWALNNLAILEYARGDWGLAVQYFERAYEINRTRVPRNAIVIAMNIGLARSNLGQHEGAAAILGEVIGLCNEIGARDLRGGSLRALGDVRLDQGRPNAAAENYRGALALRDTLDASNRNAAQLGLATSLVAMDSAAAAIDLLRSALTGSHTEVAAARMRILLSHLLRGTNDPKAAFEVARASESQTRTLDDVMVRVAALIALSACCSDVGLSDAAYRWFQQAVALREERRTASTEFEWREAFGYETTADLVDRCAIVLEHPRDKPRSERVAALFDVMQRIKARTLVERITRPSEGSSSRVFDREPMTLMRLQEDILLPGELFLDFITGNDRSFLLAVTPDSCRVVTLPGRRSPLPERIDLYGQVLSGQVRADEATSFESMQVSLGDHILGEVADLVAVSSTLIIAPDAFFNAIPFSTLVVSVNGAPRELVDALEIQRIPSATVLALSRARVREHAEAAPMPSTILAVGPGGGESLTGANDEIRFLRRTFARVAVASDGDIGAIDRHDVIHVAAHIEANSEKPWRSGILIGGQPGSLLDGIPADSAAALTGRRADVTVVETSNPADSAYAFPYDPYLRASEIAEMKLPAHLAVLSGCESALGRASTGEGVLGLSAAFLSAGTPCVVATLWPVDDRVTADFMERFYRELARGGTVSDALQTAQQDLRVRSGTRHPMFWAGFVTIGDGSLTVALDGRPWAARNLYALATLAMVLVLALLAWIGGRARRRARERQRISNEPA